MSQVMRNIALRNDEMAPRHARRAVRNALLAWEYDGSVTDAAVLLTSELATNAIRHAPDSIDVTLRLTVLLDVLTVEVFDESPAVPVQRCPSVDSQGGRGLAIVQAVAAENGGRCGYRTHPGGKSVFVTLKVPPVPDRVQARELAGYRGVR